MPIDLKYGRVTLEHQRNVGDEEPVIVFRAQDALVLEVLSFYADRCQREGSPAGHIEQIERTFDAIQAWQQDHPTKIPTSSPVPMP